MNVQAAVSRLVANASPMVVVGVALVLVSAYNYLAGGYGAVIASGIGAILAFTFALVADA